jgi:FdhD protein
MFDDDVPETLRPYRKVAVIRVGRAGDGPAPDLVAVEEPLEIRLQDQPFAVIMRTPGDDKALAAGFLLAEDVIESSDDLGAVEHCRHPDQSAAHNVVNVFLRGRALEDSKRRLAERRNVVTNSSCGICGRVTIESLRTRAPVVPITWTIAKAVVAGFPATLRSRQRVFEGTGGLHAAGLFDTHGVCELAAEDVGRHNAVDKVIGEMVLADRLPLGNHVLTVSGRTSFEIVQKAWLAGVGLVCAVSAPSSLAIALAEDAGITLLGFVRDGGFNVYTHPARLSEV